MAHDIQRILVLNSGSSSLKFALLSTDGNETYLSGLAERLGNANAEMTFKRDGEKTRLELPNGGHEQAIEALLAFVDDCGWTASVIAVGHRVVHGGERFSKPELLTEEVIKGIEEVSALAPLHNPSNLLGIRTAQRVFPNLPQVAVFDTAFHQTMAPAAYHYAIPQKYYREFSVRRYGAHGTSHDYVTQQTVETLGLDPDNHGILIAHLGNGASATAVKNGKSVDTTMGLTPLEGLVMGTRSGDIDPGAIVHIARQEGLSINQIDTLLNKESGLKGLSGISHDCRELEEAAEAGNADAQLSLDVFTHRLARLMGGLATNLDRLDAIVFTGGIGENSDILRAATVKKLKLLGATLDDAANARTIRGNAGVISEQGSQGPTVAVINTNEELMIARSTMALI